MARPRSEQAHRDVLNAAAQLFAEQGIEGTSMDAIAEGSGVSKATIYKHWVDKDALLLETMSYLAGLEERPPFDTGDTLVDLIAVLAHKPPTERSALLERITPHLIAYSARNPGFGVTWRRVVMEPPRRDLCRVLTQGIERGELPSDLNFEVAIALLLGPMLYTLVFRKNEPVPELLAEQVANAFWRASALGSGCRRAKLN